MPQVRLIGADGEQIGIKSRDEALEYAWNLNLDLVEVAPDARPPVCRVMDHSKYKYEQEQKAKLARRHQNVIVIKEIKLRPKVGQHDYETKRGHVIRFLKNRDKVKVTIMFRGRETTHPERGQMLLLRLAEDVKDLATIEAQPLLDGRNMTMLLAPVRKAETDEPEIEPVEVPKPVPRQRRQARLGARDGGAATAVAEPESRPATTPDAGGEPPESIEADEAHAGGAVPIEPAAPAAPATATATTAPDPAATPPTAPKPRASRARKREAAPVPTTTTEAESPTTPA